MEKKLDFSESFEYEIKVQIVAEAALVCILRQNPKHKFIGSIKS